MPLPVMTGDPSTLMDQPGLSAPPPEGPGTGSTPEADPKAQVKGAIEASSQLRSASQQQLSAIATQFPSVSQDAQELMKLLDQGIQRLVKKLISTVQMPEPQAPPAVR